MEKKGVIRIFYFLVNSTFYNISNSEDTYILFQSIARCLAGNKHKNSLCGNSPSARSQFSFTDYNPKCLTCPYAKQTHSLQLRE